VFNGYILVNFLLIGVMLPDRKSKVCSTCKNFKKIAEKRRSLSNLVEIFFIPKKGGAMFS